MKGWSVTQQAFLINRGVHHMFEAQVQRTPETVAVAFKDQTLTYAELDRRANQLSQRLRELGVGPNTLVGLCVERSLEMTIALLGIWKAGGAYVSLDPTYPISRLQFMLADAKAPVLLIQDHLRKRLPEHGAYVIAIDAEQTALEKMPDVNLETAVTGANLAYVIYTSGSTGQPKGVCLPHRTLTNLLTWHLENLSGGMRTLQFASLSFDASIHEMFAAWASGGTLVLVPEPLRRDIGGLAEFLIEQQLEKVILPVTVLQQLAEIYQSRACAPSMLREIISTGEQLRITGAVRTLFKQVPQCSLHNHYGPSETHVVTAYTLAGSPQDWPTKPPIGTPITNTQLYVLDAQMQSVTEGQPGELYVGGASLADGYLNRPELTAEKFVTYPGLLSERVYRTGDLVRSLADGTLEFIGRIDQQVKVRGFRVEPGEIEAVLAHHPDICSTVVVAQATVSSAQHLVAYVVPTIERSPTLGGRRRHTLPNGMSMTYINTSEADALYEVIFSERRYSRYGLSINPGDCVFDVGGNMGMFTVFASQEADDVKIYTFEPNPTLSEVLRLNAQIYGSDVVLYDKGLSNTEKTAPFSFYREVSTFSGFYANPDEEAQNYRQLVTNLADQYAIQLLDTVMAGRFKAENIQCQLTTISHVIREHSIDRIDYLKINVEKSELDVLVGIANEDWSKIQKIFVEVHETDGQTEQIKCMLKDQGFNVVMDQVDTFQHTNIFQLYATRPHTSGTETATDGPARSYKPLISVDEVRGFLAERMPDYMVPATYVFLEALPLTLNGKVDVQALPTPTTARLNLSSPPPRTPLERTLVDIWSDVLGIEEIGAHDDFFQLGGHSLLGTQVLSRIRQTFGVEMTLHVLFEWPTIAGLAEHINRLQTLSSISNPDTAGEEREAFDL